MTQQQGRFLPLIVAISIIIGILVGTLSASLFSKGRLNVFHSSSNKLTDLFYLVNDEYVDSVSIPGLVEKSLPIILQQLDPHSVYISPQEVESSMQDLEGSFSGVGVQFTIYHDTVRVVSVVKGGPSESAGIKAGDKIVNVDGKPFVGDSLTNDLVMKNLNGKKGSTVKLQILRNGQDKPLHFSINRGDVPVNSISAAYKLDDNTGYIRINTFGKYTFSEFWTAMAKLCDQHIDNLVLDLRGNPGGYMQPAIQIANEFLKKDQLIVYTEGRKSPREDFRCNGRGAYQELPLVVLVDETSASASEILSGALQDNDRATIVGRRTFGKGLVQVPIEFNDGSMVRLTTARYYTPSGRCVQKPYKPGEDEEYFADLLMREQHGEFYSADSIHIEGETYQTLLGRTVYGGGGIMPDVFTPADTIGITPYFRDAYIGGYIFQFAYDFTDRHRKELEKISEEKELTDFLNRHNIVGDFATYAEKNGLKRNTAQLMKSATLFKKHLTGSIINDVLGEEATYMFQNHGDATVQKALQLVRDGRTFPVVEQKAARLAPAHARGVMLPYSVFGHHGAGMANAYAPCPYLLSPYALCPYSRNKRFDIA